MASGHEDIAVDPQKPRGIKRLIKATGYSLAGLRAAWHHEEAFRLEVVLLVLLTPLAWWLGDSGFQRALLMGSLVLVLIVELINSAIEAIVDRFGGDHHELSGRAKDIGSAAVLIAIANALMVWLLVACDGCHNGQ
jgi:diacylglycerol kinase (ATP)